ncbi:MAG: hypothetical protein ABH829_00240 [archaeon]
MGISPENYNEIRKAVLRRLYRETAWGKGHLLFERLQSGIDAHLRGYVKYVLHDLMQQRLVCCYGKTRHGDAYYLNMSKKAEIERIISQPSR